MGCRFQGGERIRHRQDGPLLGFLRKLGQGQTTLAAGERRSPRILLKLLLRSQGGCLCLFDLGKGWPDDFIDPGNVGPKRLGVAGRGWVHLLPLGENLLEFRRKPRRSLRLLVEQTGQVLV